MVVSKGIVKVSSVIVNLICTLIVPCVESLAYKLSIGGVCECPSPLSSPATERGRKRKKLKNNSGSSGSTEQSNHHHHHHNDVKRIKLLLDITVGQNGSEVLDIKASTKGNSREKYRSKEGQCKGKPGFVLRLLNLPSSILLYFAQRVRQLAHDLEALEEQPSCDNSRIKKSPKRRITRGNYRKIIPFFPFNLLGFSNYSAFQMPSITRSSSSTTTGGTTDEKNNLNVSSVSANGKSRSKRPRHTSTEDDSFSDLSDEDIAYLELPESLSSSMLTGNANISASAGGHDEVDSDETAETIRKKGSASSSEKNPLLPHHRLSSGRAGRRSSGSRRVQVHLNTSTSEDNCGNLTSYTDLDSSNNGGVLGEDHRVEFTFIKELNEAANESYNSIDDPDYVPAEESCTSTSDTSYATDKGCSDESLLAENGIAIKNGEDKEEKSNEVIAAVVEQNVEKEAEEPGNVTLTNGTTSPVNGSETQITSTTPAAATTTSSAPQSKVAPNSGGGGGKKKNKNKKQNGNGTPKNGNRSNVSTTGNEDDYKTPEEGEHEGVRHF